MLENGTKQPSKGIFRILDDLVPHKRIKKIRERGPNKMEHDETENEAKTTVDNPPDHSDAK
jgi:hypothetical protein